MMGRPQPALSAKARRSFGTLAAALLIAGCAAPAALESEGPSSKEAASPSASATPSGSGLPSATPAPTSAFEAPSDILPPNSLVKVVVDALQLRAKPGLSAAVVSSASAGDEFRVIYVYGPVMLDGLAWYRLATPTIEAVLWAAAESGSDRYLEVVPPIVQRQTPTWPR